jgi:ribosomal protein L14E/L6E/L27E
MESVLPGQVVVSKAGRDAGRKFVVVRIINELYVEIADGDLRKIEKPKKKKLKHLRITGHVIDHIRQNIENNVRVTNAEIRKALAELAIELQ